MPEPYTHAEISTIVRAGYDRIAGRYLSSRSFGHDVADLQAFASALSLGARVFDVGCGCGWPVGTWLSHNGYRVIGLDLSPVQVRLAREQVPGAYFAVRDACTLQPGEYTAGGIVSMNTFFHIPRVLQPRVLSALRSFLPEGGPLLITFGTTQWEGVEESVSGVPMYWSQQDPATNRRMVEAAGFDISTDRIDKSLALPAQIIVARATSSVKHK